VDKAQHGIRVSQELAAISVLVELFLVSAYSRMWISGITFIGKEKTIMSEPSYTYVIVGGGLAGASAVQGIRERDENGSVLLIGSEEHLPYDRPPLSKKLWFGKKKSGGDFRSRRGV
jgi:hypothetical protein